MKAVALYEMTPGLVRKWVIRDWHEALVPEPPADWHG